MSKTKQQSPVRERRDTEGAPEKGKIFMETFGCQMNFLDSELIQGNLKEEGFGTTESKDEADVILYNTCSVRAHAEQKALSHLGTLKHLKSERPEVVIGVVGCMAQRRGESLMKKMPHIDLICGTDHYPELPSLIQDIRKNRNSRVALERTDEVDMDNPPRHRQFRESEFQAYLLAMKGCGCRCTFCVVPATRGKDVSRTPDEIRREMQELAADGVREVTLLGQNITEYGKNMEGEVDRKGSVFQDPDAWEYNLEYLLRHIHDVEGIDRIRFVTSHPAFTTEGLFRAMGELDKVMPYLHIPVQSGSNRMLKKMARGVTREEYLEICDMAREHVPEMNIASDFIVGFPGETEEDFKKSQQLIDEADIGQSYIFKYSPRPNTPAREAFEDDVPEEVKDERNHILLDVQEKVSLRRHMNMIGKRVPVLVEGPSKTDKSRYQGRAPGNDIVVFPIEDRDLEGQIVTVEIENATSLTLFGSLVESEQESTA